MEWEDLFDRAAEHETTMTAIRETLADHRSDG